MLRLTRAVRFTAPSGRDLIFGVMDPQDIEDLKVDAYQRSQLPIKSIEEWQQAFYAGEVPPLDLGSRTKHAQTTATGVTVGGNEIFVIDGLQRLTTAKLLRNQGKVVFLPVMVYLGTTRAWEVDRFSKLNARQVRVSTNVLLRNANEQNPAITLLYAYTEGSHISPLSGRVQWTQGRRVGNLMTAVTLLKSAAALYSHLGKNMHDTNAAKLSWALADVVDELGADTFTRNLDIFFDILDSACKMASLQGSQGVVQLSLSYMTSLATVLSSYQEFWDGNRLVVSEAVREELVKFRPDPLQAREISNLGRKSQWLMGMLAKKAHGARRQRLTPWEQ